MGVQTCGLSYGEGIGRRIAVQTCPRQKPGGSTWNITKVKRGSGHGSSGRTLNSNLSITKKKKEIFVELIYPLNNKPAVA
jgi:hypothetical protein